MMNAMTVHSMYDRLLVNVFCVEVALVLSGLFTKKQNP
jgi:hypothetical protein